MEEVNTHHWGWPASYRAHRGNLFLQMVGCGTAPATPGSTPGSSKVAGKSPWGFPWGLVLFQGSSAAVSHKARDPRDRGVASHALEAISSSCEQYTGMPVPANMPAVLVGGSSITSPTFNSLKQFSHLLPLPADGESAGAKPQFFGGAWCPLMTVGAAAPPAS